MKTASLRFILTGLNIYSHTRISESPHFFASGNYWTELANLILIHSAFLEYLINGSFRLLTLVAVLRSRLIYGRRFQYVSHFLVSLNSLILRLHSPGVGVTYILKSKIRQK